MKNSLLLILAIVTFTASSYSQVAHWPLDQDANDITGENHGVPTENGVSFVNDPERGEVMLLDGIEGYVTLPSYMLSGMDNGTFTCWFNFYGGGDWQRVYGFGHIDDPWAMYYICPQNGWGGANFFVSMLALGGEWQDYEVFPIDANKWYFTAGVFDTDTFRFYLNDTLVLNKASQTKPSDIMSDPNEAYIGRSHWSADPTYNGMIDDMRIYNYAMSESEVMELFSEASVNIPEKEPDSKISLWGYNGRIYYNGVNEAIIKKVSVHNIMGQLIFSSDCIGDLQNENFLPGPYIVNIKKNDGIVLMKVMVLK
ncbi:hypothetical protein ES705_39011 [subsurface metagenome]